jgi:hypothetical protein
MMSCALMIWIFGYVSPSNSDTLRASYAPSK